MSFKGVSSTSFQDVLGDCAVFQTGDDTVVLGDEIVLVDEFILPGVVVHLETPTFGFARFNWEDQQLCLCELVDDYCSLGCAFDAQSADGGTAPSTDPEFKKRYPVASIEQLREVVRTL